MQAHDTPEARATGSDIVEIVGVDPADVRPGQDPHRSGDAQRASPAERTPAITALAFSCVYVGKHLEPVGGELFTLVAKSAHLAGLPDVPDRLDLARRQDVRLGDRR